MKVYRKSFINIIITAECHYGLILGNKKGINMRDTITYSHEACLLLFVFGHGMGIY